MYMFVNNCYLMHISMSFREQFYSNNIYVSKYGMFGITGGNHNSMHMTVK